MGKEIAIIGISLQFAFAKGLAEYWDLISGGKNCFGALSETRKKDLFDRFGEKEIITGAYLDRVDLFDNEFFNIAQRDAERMDPEQRLMMEYGARAIQNAGYSLSELKGQQVGIFHTVPVSAYRYFFDEFSNSAILGHFPAMVGARIANFFDWRGPVIGIETSCSSSLVAVQYACDAIRNGECRMSMACGVKLGVGIGKVRKDSPMMSKKGQCLPFDESADGAVSGEGVVCVLLKSLEDAIKDRDPIHAVIKGGAINHSGGLVQNIASPNPVSQSEVIKKAWEKSNIDPADVGFIEAHGTGTYLGDPIEFSGIALAFDEYTEPGKKICSVSSGKGTIGHLDSLSGLAGLTRLVLAIKNKKLLPQPGLSGINRQINEEHSPVRIPKTMQNWESKGKLRVGGVTSYGLTGTNVHIVVEEYTDPGTSPNNNEQRNYLLKIGGRNQTVMNRNIRYLIDYLRKNREVNLSRLVYSVNRIIDEDQFRHAIVFSHFEELMSGLQTGVAFAGKQSRDQQLFFLIPGIFEWSDMSSFLCHSEELSMMYETKLKELKIRSHSITDQQRSFLLHFCSLQLIMKAGLTADRIMGGQSGKLLANCLLQKDRLLDTAIELASVDRVSESINKDGFYTFLSSLDKDNHYTIILAGAKGKLFDLLNQWIADQNVKNIEIVCPKDGQDVFLSLIAAWYNKGYSFNFEKIRQKEMFLQDFQPEIFEPKRFWPAQDLISLSSKQ